MPEKQAAASPYGPQSESLFVLCCRELRFRICFLTQTDDRRQLVVTRRQKTACGQTVRRLSRSLWFWLPASVSVP